MDDRRYITDRFQYVESNYAGYGLPEVVGFLRQQAARQPIVVLTRDTTGMPRDGVTAYLQAWPNVALGFVRETDSIETGLQRRPDRVYQLAVQGADVYYVLSDAPDGDQERRFRRLNPTPDLVLEVAKPGNHSRFQLYRTHWSGPRDDVFLDPPASFGGQLVLRGYRLSGPTAHPGDAVELTIFWEASARPERDYTVFNHIVGPQGELVGQKDALAGESAHPTSRWRPGEVVADRFQVVIKPEAPPGSYDLVTGLYELQTMRRLPVEGGGGRGDHVVLTRLTVTAP
jgi:hypothetical protein